MELKELRQKMGEAVAKARAINDPYAAKGEKLPADMDAQYKAHMGEFNTLKDQVAEIEEATTKARALEDADAYLHSSAGTLPGMGGSKAFTTKGDTDDAAVAVKGLFRQWLQAGKSVESDYQRAFNQYRQSRSPEVKALMAGDDTLGGYLVPPQDFVNDFIRNIENEVFMRGISNVLRVSNSRGTGVTTLTSNLSGAVWGSEITPAIENTAMAFGKRELIPHPMSSYVKLSRTLVEDAAMNIEALIAQELARTLGQTQEQGYLTGTGAAQPLGIFTASDQGIPTSRDKTAAGATSLEYADIVNLRGNLKLQHRKSKNTYWLMHRDVVTELAKIVDDINRPIWREGLTAEDPDRLLGIPIVESEYAPNTITASQYVIALGNFHYYYIADRFPFTLQRNDQLFMGSDQIAFYGRLSTDGAPLLAEAFTRLKMHA